MQRLRNFFQGVLSILEIQPADATASSRLREPGERARPTDAEAIQEDWLNVEDDLARALRDYASCNGEPR
jgi:hypothetical protein